MDPVIDQPIPNTQAENPPLVTSTLSAEPAQQASTEDANPKEKLKPIQTAHSVIRIDDKDLKRHISFQQGGETSPTIPRSPTNKSPKLRLFVEQNILNNPTLIKQSRVKDDERIFSFDELGLDTRPMSTYSLETTDTIESNVIQSFSSLRLSYQKTMEMRRQPVLAGYAKRFFEFQLFLYREFSSTMMSNHIKGVLILLDVLVDIAFLMLYLVEVSLSDTPDKDNPNLQPYYIYINRPQIIYHLAFAFSMWNLASFVSREGCVWDQLYNANCLFFCRDH
ncbi:hypothetical protein BKA69DRAFT_204490 [Paraphysoderma sedebokerense]|nr:hypothetical protein BKA69DRAFT_204490 [Paraphysoderma sedebokerense]